MKIIEDGCVCSPAGFRASGVSCGIKAGQEKDLAMITADSPSVVKGVFTGNAVKGHSLKLTMKHIKENPRALAVVINSGNANACLGERGDDDAIEIARETSSLLGCSIENVLPGSTGVIGVPLDMDRMRRGLKSAAATLSASGGHDAARAIMTTDTVPKEIAVEFTVKGKPAKIGGMAKGSGMIHPDMATMIGILTSDVSISGELLEKAFRECIDKSFNRISVDGETSVCDMVLVLCNGACGNCKIEQQDQSYEEFREALDFMCTALAIMVARDGEGATKLIEINVEGARTKSDALKIASAVAKSPLVKTAIFGEDANWGRIITAAGYSGARFNPELTDIFIGELKVCSKGTGLGFDEEKAAEILGSSEVSIRIDLNQGKAADRIWTCDLTYDYIKINGSYRT